MKQENYWVLGIIGIIFFVALVLVFREKLPFREKKETTIITPTIVKVKGTTNPKPVTKSEPQKMQIDTNKQYEATLKTELGDIVIELNVKQTPITVNNFITLSKKDFYNNTIFHRVIKGFMIQGGDPKGDGTGGPGYTIPDELGSGNKNNKGTISMANAGPDTGGSQFFINLVDNNFLDDKHAVFGNVTKGMDVVEAIEKVKTGQNDRPVDAVTIQTVTITEK